MEKIKKFVKSKTEIVVVILFLLMKIFLGMVELPHYNKTSTEIPFLLLTFLFAAGCVGAKFFIHKYQLIRKVPYLQFESFLLWVVTMIYIIFSWSLCDALGWNLFEKIMIVLCQALQTFLITLFLDPKFVSKLQFFGIANILGGFLMMLAIKTVGFIKDDSESAHKDIVILNLSTQIALIIILMDAIEKSYSKMKKEERSEDMSRIENELVIVK